MSHEQLSLSVLTPLAPILFAVLFVARTHAKTSPTHHRAHLVALLFSCLGPSPTLRIVTCSVNLIELDEPDFYNPSIQAWFATERTANYVWHVDSYPNGALPVDNTAFLAPPTCQYNVLSAGGAATAKWLRNTRIFFPNLLVGIPKEEISLASGGNAVQISPRSPTTPTSSSFAEVWRDVILPVIRYDHIFPMGGVMADEEEKPALDEMTKVRGPLLGGQPHPYNHHTSKMEGYIRDQMTQRRGADGERGQISVTC
ncbi:uncharacterized protein LOC118437716 [Folsomia candida]|uniref:Uncharacterized protein n=1 Tax=Folsomia candida TaxID=158441 RepID=A0A226DLY0_FOLCA|nr:uncharacterized protein LOC118437716 [Folsomia candida]OXA46545.1 hypothetical protein Fcan01_18827 [Folsomia candida]